VPYSGDPTQSPADSVRFLLGDTDNTDLLLSDGEIGFLLSEWSNVYDAAAAGADQLAAQFSREIDYSGDGISTTTSELQQQFIQLATQLRQLSKRKGRLAAPYVGGISRADVEKALADGDTIQTMFATGMHDNLRQGGEQTNTDVPNPLLSDQSNGVGGGP
jgi:hypothetical protein